MQRDSTGGGRGDAAKARRGDYSALRVAPSPARALAPSLSPRLSSPRPSPHLDGFALNRVINTMKSPTINNTAPGAASDTLLWAPSTFAVQLVEPVTPLRNKTIPPPTQVNPRTS